MNAVDHALSSFINAPAHRSITMDMLIVFISNDPLIKGGVVIGLALWAWFQREQISRAREALLSGFIGLFPALIVTRLTEVMYLRPRPFNEPLFPTFRPPYGVDTALWQGTSSFPSDHATLFFALAMGIFLASRQIGWIAFGYVTFVICLPRVYIGEHYPTDIVAGAAIGIAATWLINLFVARQPVAAWALTCVRDHPALFYWVGFLLAYQIVELFTPAASMLHQARLVLYSQMPRP